MFTIPRHLSHLAWPEFGNDVCYLFDTDHEHKSDCRIYAIQRDYNGNDGEHCSVASAPMKIWHNLNLRDYWFRHTLVDNDHMIVTDYNGLTVWDRDLRTVFHCPVTADMQRDNDVYGYTYKDGTLTYWVIYDDAGGNYHKPAMARDGQLHVMDLGINI